MNIIKIKTLKDAAAFLKKEVEGYRHGIQFHDDTISRIGGGSTRLFFKNNEVFFYCSGENWSDKKEALIETPVRWVYTHRKGINASWMHF